MGLQYTHKSRRGLHILMFKNNINLLEKVIQFLKCKSTFLVHFKDPRCGYVEQSPKGCSINI